MGQKVNPHGLRVGIMKDWDSQWYEEKEVDVCVVKPYQWKIGRVKIWKNSFCEVKNFIRSILKYCKKKFLRQRLLI